jgi:hypothetical protein
MMHHTAAAAAAASATKHQLLACHGYIDIERTFTTFIDPR